MNRLLCAAAIFALVVPSAAVAQHHNDKQDNGHQAQNHRGHGKGTQHQAQSHQGHGRGGQHQARGTARPAQGQRTVTVNRNVQNVNRQRTRNVQTVSHQRPGGHVTHIRRVHASRFRYPRGYRYRRWSAGSILPMIFLSNYYFYNNWAAVGAYPPPPGYMWVRYGPDLLLVSRRSGRIRDVIYGVFY